MAALVKLTSSQFLGAYMRIHITSGDILQVPADTLICSANIFLNLSGGVGGSFRITYGEAIADRIQRDLHALLKSRPGQRANPGEVFYSSGQGTPFQHILHAIAIDAMYQTSVEFTSETIGRALTLACSHNARCIALAALATGYGNLSMAQFGQAAKAALATSRPSIETVTICVRKVEEAEELRKIFAV